jgi:hypothetical protein
LEARLATVLADDLKAAEVRAAALAAKPIAINSALDRKESGGPITPTVNRTAPEPEPVATEDDGTPWMDAEREAAMQAAIEVEEAERSASKAKPSRRQTEAAETLDGGPLPELDDMIAKVPADLQEKMDDLFRAKFQTVKRVPAAVLKSETPSASPKHDC